jgi:Mg-chelatase subunit ChlD
MRILTTVLAGALLLAAVPAVAQKTAVPYKIEFNPERDVQRLDSYENKEGLFLSVGFTITLQGTEIDETSDNPAKNYKLRIEENGKYVKSVELPQPQPSADLAVVLAMDISSRMKIHGGIDQARRASGVFFNSLPAQADCGLILFNHKVVSTLPLSKDRNALRSMIASAQPRGGTAYLDAAEKAIEMLAGSPIKTRALVVLTDGVDINSTSTLERVVALAKKAKVRVFTIGIGEPGRQDRVTSVLVLDKSGSMNLPANERDKVTKLQALKSAAEFFINSIGSTRRTTIVEFSDDVQAPREFTNDKFALKGIIKNIVGKGETAVFDAVYTAVMTLDADPDAGGGKRAVVALTDGIDNSSRRRVDEVIARAKETGIPLFMLGFGRKGELDVKTMEHMAKETKGKFFYAENEQALVQLFEDLSVELHDDGIDELSLGTLAKQTGGKYYAAKTVSNLDLVLQTVTKSIQRKEYRITFPSLNQRRDGLPRIVALKLVRLSGDSPGNPGTAEVVEEKSGGVQVHGLVIAEMHPLVYLVLLVILCGLIALPAALKRRTGN